MTSQFPVVQDFFVIYHSLIFTNRSLKQILKRCNWTKLALNKKRRERPWQQKHSSINRQGIGKEKIKIINIKSTDTIHIYTYQRLSCNGEVGCLRTSRGFCHWQPTPRWRPLPWLANPGNPAMMPHTITFTLELAMWLKHYFSNLISSRCHQPSKLGALGHLHFIIVNYRVHIFSTACSISGSTGKKAL